MKITHFLAILLLITFSSNLYGKESVFDFSSFEENWDVDYYQVKDDYGLKLVFEAPIDYYISTSYDRKYLIVHASSTIRFISKLKIAKIQFIFKSNISTLGTPNQANKSRFSVGTYTEDAAVGTWIGSATNMVVSVGASSGTSKMVQIVKIIVTYESEKLGEEFDTASDNTEISINESLNAAYQYNGVLYCCTNKDICSHPSINSNIGQDYYENKVEDFDQRDWIALYNIESPESYVGKVISNVKGTYSNTRPGYNLSVSSITVDDQKVVSSSINSYKIANLILHAIAKDGHSVFFVKPQINELAYLYANIKKDNNSNYILHSNDGEISVDPESITEIIPSSSINEFRKIEGIIKYTPSTAIKMKDASSIVSDGTYSFIITKDEGIATDVKQIDYAIDAYPYVVSSCDGVSINNANNKRYVISNVAGQIIIANKCASVQEAIPLSPGFYIINIDNQSFKIIVQ